MELIKIVHLNIKKSIERKKERQRQRKTKKQKKNRIGVKTRNTVNTQRKYKWIERKNNKEKNEDK